MPIIKHLKKHNSLNFKLFFFKLTFSEREFEKVLVFNTKLSHIRISNQK